MWANDSSHTRMCKRWYGSGSKKGLYLRWFVKPKTDYTYTLEKLGTGHYSLTITMKNGIVGVTGQQIDVHATQGIYGTQKRDILTPFNLDVTFKVKTGETYSNIEVKGGCIFSYRQGPEMSKIYGAWDGTSPFFDITKSYSSLPCYDVDGFGNLTFIDDFPISYTAVLGESGLKKASLKNLVVLSLSEGYPGWDRILNLYAGYDKRERTNTIEIFTDVDLETLEEDPSKWLYLYTELTYA